MAFHSEKHGLSVTFQKNPKTILELQMVQQHFEFTFELTKTELEFVGSFHITFVVLWEKPKGKFHWGGQWSESNVI